MVSNLRNAEANQLDAQTYLEKVNALNLGSYAIEDGSEFPEYVEIKRVGASEVKKHELDVLEVPKDIVFCDMCGKMLEQLEPHLAKGEADIYVQQVKLV